MAKETKLLRKARLQLWKESENLKEKFRGLKDAVKPLSAINWKVQYVLNKKTDW